eukprot:CAMPEP_0196574738 /NCGR_PEP_ID=MMETSP1081-20130531/4391_1 /TAXON_ID=36882 /ORGANISM="Pyramimonas amylifera, Strain CCMP720" /LENGTH=190 /DNA_ID=CAMNT_0041892847 /DNA_START=78 /DNA_END=646 /DNA_ORIENTATION=+
MIKLGKKWKESLNPSKLKRSDSLQPSSHSDRLDKVIDNLERTLVSPGNLTAKEWLWLFSLTQEEPSCSKCLDYIRKKLKEMVALKKPDTTWFILWKGLCMLEFLCVSGPTPVLSYLIAHHHLHSDAYLFHLENNFHTLHPTPPGAPAPGVDMGQLVRSKAKKIIETVCDSDRHATLRQESMGFVQLPGFL